MADVIIFAVGDTYNCFVTQNAVEVLGRGGKLETDLLDEERNRTGKKVSLRMRNVLLGGEGDLDTIPPNVGFQCAREILLTISPNSYEILQRQKYCNPRWSYGDIFVKIVEDVEAFR